MKRDPVDMSPRAIALRLDEVRDLFRLTEYLVRFRPAKEADGSVEADVDTPKQRFKG